jgi:hypothetical protein
MGCETIEEIDIEVRRIDNIIFSTNSSAQPEVNCVIRCLYHGSVIGKLRQSELGQP